MLRLPALQLAARWFGQPPPDMSLIARSRGTDYIFNFLKGFYLDSESPMVVSYFPLSDLPSRTWERTGVAKLIAPEPDAQGAADNVVALHG